MPSSRARWVRYELRPDLLHAELSGGALGILPRCVRARRCFADGLTRTRYYGMQNHDVGSLPAWKQDRTPSTSSSGADMAWARVVGTSHNDTDDWIMQRHHLLG